MVRQNGLQRLLLEGKIHGKRGKRRPRIVWTIDIKEWTGKTYDKCVRAAENKNGGP